MLNKVKSCRSHGFFFFFFIYIYIFFFCITVSYNLSPRAEPEFSVTDSSPFRVSTRKSNLSTKENFNCSELDSENVNNGMTMNRQGSNILFTYCYDKFSVSYLYLDYIIIIGEFCKE